MCQMIHSLVDECTSGRNPHKNVCYNFYQDTKNCPTSEQLCADQVEGGHLAAIDSNETSNFIKAYLDAAG